MGRDPTSTCHLHTAMSFWIKPHPCSGNSVACRPVWSKAWNGAKSPERERESEHTNPRRHRPLTRADRSQSLAESSVCCGATAPSLERLQPRYMTALSQSLDHTTRHTGQSDHLTDEYMSSPWMYGLLGYRQRYNYLKIWNLRVQKHINIEKIIFTVVQMSPKKSL